MKGRVFLFIFIIIYIMIDRETGVNVYELLLYHRINIQYTDLIFNQFCQARNNWPLPVSKKKLQ